jgi:hypothetical protein
MLYALRYEKTRNEIDTMKHILKSKATTDRARSRVNVRTKLSFSLICKISVPHPTPSLPLMEFY